jgi:hypothetical protein
MQGFKLRLLRRIGIGPMNGMTLFFRTWFERSGATFNPVTRTTAQRGERDRIISARPAEAGERAIYETGGDP